MSEYRQLHQAFWASQSVESLDPIEKLIYLYLITGPLSNMEGLYKVSLKRMSFETGIEPDMCMKICKRLEDESLAGWRDGWVCVTQAANHMSSSPTMLKHSKKVYEDTPGDVLAWVNGIGYQYPKGISDTLSIADNTLSYTRLDKTRQNKTTPKKVADKSALPAPMKDEFKAYIDQWFYSRYPYTSFGKERKAVTGLAAKAVRQSIDTGVATSMEVADAMMAAYEGLISGRDKFWNQQPLTPSGLLSMWDRVVSTMRAKAPQEIEPEVQEFIDAANAR